MANHKSAAKQARRNEAQRLRNRYWRARLRTQLKRFRKACEQGGRDAASELLPKTLGTIDRTARAGVIHGNTASRYKARLQKRFNRL
jgi:small subunit ribosomal protein S20